MLSDDDEAVIAIVGAGIGTLFGGCALLVAGGVFIVTVIIICSLLFG